ncbi:hypothetical protein RPT71_005351 [Raoultella ornithinolytica]|uniref:hypothetical protein n=1 Tax=Raoultella ornithinolytica TaxID=54291 RepID=UPI0025A6E0D7|nr:hypothetical protein [Raoultella ornithinolytica]ELH1434247.1 hypothetical protein [Raoultella ornithinolytica]HEQ2046531.1 hypothetical protein [Raoultella ornithinolytica]
MANETEFKFGDYAIIEQKRHGVPSEMFVHKVIGIRRSNSWVDVPVQSPATETLHCGMEVVCLCICCGIDETKVRQYRVKDMQRSSRSPDSELTAALATIEKCREVSGCPAGVDLQDHLRQLAAENVALKAAFNKPDAWLSWHSIPPTYQEPDRGGEYLAVHEQPGEKNDDGSDSWPVYAKPEIETPVTDRIVAGIKADGLPANIAEIIDSGDLETICYESERSYAEDFRLALYNFRQLREGADK